MILGSYPCCGAALSIGLPDGRLPQMMKEECPECGEIVWHKLARLDPQSWTEEDFLKEYDVDEETKATTKKPQE